MSLIAVILNLAVVGFVVWLVVTYIPMPEPIKKAIIVIVVIAVVLWLLGVTGFVPSITMPVRGHY